LKVIDSLGHGFQAVARRWWLILIPILLDTLLWVGPRISIQDLVQEAIRTFETELAAQAPTGEDVDGWLDVFAEGLNQVKTEYNALAGLRVGTLGVPSLLIWRETQIGSPYEGLWVLFLTATDMSDLLAPVSRASFALSTIWEVQNEGTWLLLVLGLSVAGTAIGSIYLTLLWQGTEPDLERRPFWSRAAKLGVRFVLFWLLRAVVLVTLTVPFVLALALINVLSPRLADFFASISIGLAIWLSFYGTFVLTAMIVNDAPVLRAIWNSIGVVLRNFWPTLWLFVLINLIGGGLTIFWQQIAHGAWAGLAIVGNAYVGTSLIAASLLYYQDHYLRWQEAVAELLAKQGKQTT
jgi:hypothetical protein